MPAFLMLSHGRATAPRSDGARPQGWCLGQKQSDGFVACTRGTHDSRAIATRRARRARDAKGEPNAAVPTCHIGTILTALGVNVTRALCLADKLLGARDELVDPTGRAAGGWPNNSHVSG